MKLVRYVEGHGTGLGALVGDRLVDLPRLCAAPAEVDRLLASPEILNRVQQAVSRISPADLSNLPLTAGVELLPPLAAPGKIIGVGLNYPAAGQARSSARTPFPVLFERNRGSIIGPGAAIRLPRQSRQVVIECELALVVGRGGKHIPEAHALDALAGYTLANDVTARDLEQRSSQWTSGKLLDAFLPVGPAVSTRNEIEDPLDLRMRAWINDDLVQDGSSNEMLYAPAELVAYISSLITLRPGDLILTGSPKRRGPEAVPEVYLQPGDRVRLEIERLGVLENLVERDEHE